MTDLPLRDPARDLTPSDPDSGRADSPTERMLTALGKVRDRIEKEQVGKKTSVAPAVAVLDVRAEPELRRRAETAVECLQILVQAYPTDPALQDYLDVPAPLHKWIISHSDAVSPTVDFCRLDLLGDTLGTVRALEFNASSPGAVIALGLVNRLWRESSFGAQLAEWGVPPARVEEPTWFADWLLGYGRARGVSEDDLRRVGVFYDHFTAGIDLDQICDQLQRRGVETAHLYPGELDQDPELRFGYLKHIAHDPSEVNDWDTFCSRIVSGELVIPNTLAQRWVAENKLCMAALSDPRFRHLFSAEQSLTLDAIIPAGHKLGDGITPEEARARRPELVLKAPYSARGMSVAIGEDLSDQEWSSLVGDPGHQGWLVQRHVDPPVGPGNLGHRDLIVGLLDGQVIGYASRISEGNLLNLAQGGAFEAVFSPHPLGRGTH